MRAVAMTGLGKPPELTELPVPVPERGEILVQGRVVPFKRGRGRPRTRFVEVRDGDRPRVSA